jgi:hypothetical protein
MRGHGAIDPAQNTMKQPRGKSAKHRLGRASQHEYPQKNRGPNQMCHLSRIAWAAPTPQSRNCPARWRCSPSALCTAGMCLQHHNASTLVNDKSAWRNAASEHCSTDVGTRQARHSTHAKRSTQPGLRLAQIVGRTKATRSESRRSQNTQNAYRLRTSCTFRSRCGWQSVPADTTRCTAKSDQAISQFQ